MDLVFGVSFLDIAQNNKSAVYMYMEGWMGERNGCVLVKWLHGIQTTSQAKAEI